MAVAIVSEEKKEDYSTVFQWLKDAVSQLHGIDLAAQLKNGMSDAADTISAAARSQFPSTVWGNCYFHLMVCMVTVFTVFA